MIKEDSEALMCDLAETYQIYDMYSFKPSKIAVFACGLRENSRIRLKLAGAEYSTDTLILASISDSLHWIIWSKCKEGTPKPMSLLDRLCHQEKEEKEGYSVDEFHVIRNSFIEDEEVE